MLDFTSQIQLPQPYRRNYLLARAALLLAFILLALFTLYRILFPTYYFDYFFTLADAKKSTMAPPQDPQGAALKNDMLAAGGFFNFHNSLSGNFSDAEISLALKEDSAPLTKATVTARKSYQAFFYPLAAPLGFKDGTLLSQGENYYLVSNGKLAKFPSLGAAQALGFAKNMFAPATPQELALTPSGAELAPNSYPDAALFKINDEYYQLKDQKLFKFVSERAFLTNYDAAQAILKNPDFLANFPLGNDLLGFADGTLVSSPQSVFFLSGNKSYPFNNTVTFESMGFTWNDVFPATSDELGIYEKQKVFDITQPHPAGTVFFDQLEQKYFLVADGKRRELGSEAIAKTYLKKNPVLVSQAALAVQPSCELKKHFWQSRTYSCTIDVTPLETLLGNDYQFSAALGDAVNPKELHSTLKKSFKLSSFRESLANLKQQLIRNYYGEQNQ